MEQIIYGDTLFIINFSMDFLSLFLTGKILFARMRTVPLLLAASLGALYGVAALFFRGNALISLAIDLAVPAVMCLIVFGTSPATVIRATLLFGAISLFFGGGMTVLFSAINRRAALPFMAPGETDTAPIPMLLFLPAALLLALLSFFVNRLFARRKGVKSAEVTLQSDERKVRLHCLVDSGNLLTEPLSGKPVIVTSRERLLALLPLSLRSLYRSADPALLTAVDPAKAKRVRLIPAAGVGYSGLLWGYQPDRITVNGVEKDACIAARGEEGDFSGHDGILPSSLLL